MSRWSMAVILSMLLPFNGFTWGAGGTWVKKGDAPDGTYSIHSDITLKDGVVKIWQRMDYYQPRVFEGKQYFTDQFRMAYDCNGDWSAMIAAIKTTGHNGEGESLINMTFPLTPQSPKLPVNPEDPLYKRVVKPICGGGKIW